MPTFGKASVQRLETCDPRIQEVMNEVIKYFDCTVICGHRGQEEQQEAFRTGRSKVQFPSSKHNSYPSLAFDAAPYFNNPPHVRWEDREAFYFFAGAVMAIAATKGIELTWGGNWDGDDNLHNQTFFDLPHFEIKS